MGTPVAYFPGIAEDPSLGRGLTVGTKELKWIVAYLPKDYNTSISAIRQVTASQDIPR